eukprot:g13771.t1
MAKVNKESGATDSMFAHQLKKNLQQKDSLKTVEVELGAEELSGKKVFDFRQSVCLNGLNYMNSPTPTTTDDGSGGSSSGGDSTLEPVLVPQESGKSVLVSDADAQLLLKVTFRDKVNLTGLSIRCDPVVVEEESESKKPEDYTQPKAFREKFRDADSVHAEVAPPSKIRIYVNQEGLDFSDLDDYKPLQEVDFTEQLNADGEDQDASKKTKSHSHVLKVTMTGPKYQRCTSLQLFVMEALDEAELCYLNHLSITGVLAPDYHTSYT